MSARRALHPRAILTPEGFTNAWSGISSLQLVLPNIWTEMKKRGIRPERLLTWLCEGPAQFAGLAHRKGQALLDRGA